MKKENPYLRELLDRMADDPAEEAPSDALFLGSESPRFSAGFVDRVMERVGDSPVVRNFEDYLPRMFRWVAIGGAAAAVALLVLTWYQQDAVSLDALTGLANVGLTDEIALNSF